MLKAMNEYQQTKQEKINQLQKEVAAGKIDSKKRDSLEKDEIWKMSTSVRSKYFANQFFDK